jgi:hypothetical protein
VTTTESTIRPQYLSISNNRFALQYAASAICLLILIAAVSFWIRSYWFADSVNCRYSNTGEFTLFSMNGSFSVGHQDARYLGRTRGWHWDVVQLGELTKRELTYKQLSASLAGFGWKSQRLYKRNELHVRYWVPIFLTAIVAVIPWMRRRYSIRTLLVATALISLMVGLSAASYQKEIQRRKNSKRKIVVAYDYGLFSRDLRAAYGAALEKGTDFELLSLHPLPYEATPDNNFHGWRVLGKVSIAEESTRKRLVAAFKGGINAAEEGADCFDPRHGIRVNFDGQVADFVICFDCGNVEVYLGDKKQDGFSTTDTPQPAFDEVLTSEGIELGPPLNE